MMLLGGADLSQGTAAAAEVEQVESAAEARDLFGPASGGQLVTALVDALSEGAYPVYGVAAPATEITDDISGLGSSSGTLSDAPIREDPDSITVTVDGSDKTPKFVYRDPSALSVETDNVAINPATGDFELDAAPASSGSITFEALDYTAALDEVKYDAARQTDFLTPLAENQSVKAEAVTATNDLADDYRLSMALLGGELVGSPSSLTRSVNDDRAQVFFPSRRLDGSTTLGAIAGVRARVGIDTTIINSRLSTVSMLQHDLTQADRGDLIDKKVVPLDQRASSRIADDLLAVDDDTDADARYGFNRLVTDYVVNVVRINEEPFIGRLNRPATRDALASLIRNELRALTNTDAVIDFSVSVKPVSATEARAEIYLDEAEPLRFIKNIVSVGDSN